MRARQWMWAIGASLLVHAGAVIALTPSRETEREAGSGAGSTVVGSIDAILGSAVPLDNVASPETDQPAPSELAPPETIASLDAAAPPAEITPTEASEAVSSAAEPVKPPDLTPVNPAPLEADTKLAKPAEIAAASEIETARSPLQETAAAPIDEDIAAAAMSGTLAAASSAAIDPSETAAVKPIAIAAAEIASSSVETIAPAVDHPPTPPPIPKTEPEALKAVTPASAVEAVNPAREKTAKPPRKTAPQAAGNASSNSRKGATTAMEGGKTQDPGFGQSKEAGEGRFDRSDYNGRIFSKLKRMIRYPSDAARRRIGGTAMVMFRISATGGVSGLRLAGSSGDPSLDAAALDTVRRASPFPAFPAGSGLTNLEVSVPLRFSPRR